MDESSVYTADEVAQALKIKRRTVYKWVREGKLTPLPGLSVMRFLKADIDALLNPPRVPHVPAAPKPPDGVTEVDS